MRKSQYSKRYQRFREALKAARLAANLTQAEAAALLKRPQSFVSKCESGERRVDIVEFTEFCRAYNLSPDSIWQVIDNHTTGKDRREGP